VSLPSYIDTLALFLSFHFPSRHANIKHSNRRDERVGFSEKGHRRALMKRGWRAMDPAPGGGGGGDRREGDAPGGDARGVGGDGSGQQEK
jgi:hypothetical protein